MKNSGCFSAAVVPTYLPIHKGRVRHKVRFSYPENPVFQKLMGTKIKIASVKKDSSFTNQGQKSSSIRTATFCSKTKGQGLYCNTETNVARKLECYVMRKILGTRPEFNLIKNKKYRKIFACVHHRMKKKLHKLIKYSS